MDAGKTDGRQGKEKTHGGKEGKKKSKTGEAREGEGGKERRREEGGKVCKVGVRVLQTTQDGREGELADPSQDLLVSPHIMNLPSFPFLPFPSLPLSFPSLLFPFFFTL